MAEYKRPTDFEIEKTVSSIKQLLQGVKPNKQYKIHVVDGYKKIIEVLETRTTNILEIDFSNLTKVQSRAMVGLAIQYLNGRCSRRLLLGIPID